MTLLSEPTVHSAPHLMLGWSKMESSGHWEFFSIPILEHFLTSSLRPDSYCIITKLLLPRSNTFRNLCSDGLTGVFLLVWTISNRAPANTECMDTLHYISVSLVTCRTVLTARLKPLSWSSHVVRVYMHGTVRCLLSVPVLVVCQHQAHSLCCSGRTQASMTG